ncbi:MAG: UDP-2,3-diacylglucosamine diphosphatase [Pseudomonadota bacterium]
MRVFLSDLHLEDPSTAVFQSFKAIMAREAERADEIYLLGDITEVWVGDDDDGPLALALTEVLSRASERCEVALMHGNRDFLFGPSFANATGLKLLEDPTCLDDDTALAHGDAFCIEDTAYQEVRALFRSKEWQDSVLGQSLDARRELARSLRAESRTANANKAENIMDVTTLEVDRVMAELGAVRLIHGHTHRPGCHQHSWGKRTVLGAWERCAWLARQAAPGEELNLECWPLAGATTAAGPG